MFLISLLRHHPTEVNAGFPEKRLKKNRARTSGFRVMPRISVGNQAPQTVSWHSTVSLWSMQGTLSVVEMLELS